MGDGTTRHKIRIENVSSGRWVDPTNKGKRKCERRTCGPWSGSVTITGGDASVETRWTMTNR